MLFDLYTFINIFALERGCGAELERIGKMIWSGCDKNLARTLKLSNCLQLIISMVLTNSIALTSSMVLTNSITLTNSIVLIVLHGQYCIDSILLIDNIL